MAGGILFCLSVRLSHSREQDITRIPLGKFFKFGTKLAHISRIHTPIMTKKLSIHVFIDMDVNCKCCLSG